MKKKIKCSFCGRRIDLAKFQGHRLDEFQRMSKEYNHEDLVRKIDLAEGMLGRLAAKRRW